MNEADRRYHEVANIFPLMQGDEYESLKTDIATNGLLEPVWLHPGDHSIIDGRNRHRACVELEKDPKFRYWDGTGSLVSFVIGLNLHRRHLSAMQKAAVAVDILPILEEEAKQRQVEAGERGSEGGRGNSKTLVQNFEQGFPDLTQPDKPKPAPKSIDKAAAVVGTNRQYVSDMKRYKDEAQDVYEMARDGKINGSQAKELAKLPEATRKEVTTRMDTSGEDKVRKVLREVQQEQKKAPPPIAPNGYRIWYADPPWSYGNSGVINDSDGYGRAERHYPTMSIDELCDMGNEQSDMTPLEWGMHALKYKGKLNEYAAIVGKAPSSL